MQTPDPCHTANTESIELEDETLVVTVGGEPADDTRVCIQCVGRIGFEGTVKRSDPSVADDVVVETVNPWA